MVMDKVAYNISYGNLIVRERVDSIYFNPILTYDETIRSIQKWFKDFFGSEVFMDVLAYEIGKAMTGLINKMFVII